MNNSTTTILEAFADKKFPQDWRVEAIGPEGECYVVIFSGPNAEPRAREYAAWKVAGAAGPSEREAFEKIVQVALNWSNNLTEEWEKSRQTGTVYGGESFAISDDAKKYAAQCLATVWKIQSDMLQARAAVPQAPADAELLDALEELADLMEEVRIGTYKPDTFTCQPAREAIRRARAAAVPAPGRAQDKWHRSQGSYSIVPPRDAMLLEFINEYHAEPEQRDPNCYICKVAMEIAAVAGEKP